MYRSEIVLEYHLLFLTTYLFILLLILDINLFLPQKLSFIIWLLDLFYTTETRMTLSLQNFTSTILVLHPLTSKASKAAQNQSQLQMPGGVQVVFMQEKFLWNEQT